MALLWVLIGVLINGTSRGERRRMRAQNARHASNSSASIIWIRFTGIISAVNRTPFEQRIALYWRSWGRPALCFTGRIVRATTKEEVPSDHQHQGKTCLPAHGHQCPVTLFQHQQVLEGSADLSANGMGVEVNNTGSIWPSPSG